MSNAPEGQIGVHACIGNICLQWSLLEQQILFILTAIENERAPRIFLRYGGADMIPRINMAINLARDSKVPGVLVARIKAIRKVVQDDLGDKRNQAVHGVHSAAKDPHSVQLTMVRWHEPKRTQTVSALDLLDVAERLNALSNEAYAIGCDIQDWRIKVLENQRDELQRQIAERHPPAWLKITKGIKNGFNRLFGKT